MEEIAQVIVELFIQFVFEVLTDTIWRCLPEPGRLLVKALLSAALAILFAWLSTKFLPEPFITSELLRILYLILAPVLIGVTMAWIGRFFVSREKPRSILERFGFGWLFAFSFALTRYVLTT